MARIDRGEALFYLLIAVLFVMTQLCVPGPR